MRIRSLVYNFCKKSNRRHPYSPKSPQLIVDSAHASPIASSINRKYYWVFAPSFAVFVYTNFQPVIMQTEYLAYLTMTSLVPTIATTYLNYRVPFADSSMNTFYKVWAVISSTGMIAIVLALQDYPLLQNSSLIGMNLLSGVVEYIMRMEEVDSTKEHRNEEEDARLGTLSLLALRYGAIFVCSYSIWLRWRVKKEVDLQVKNQQDLTRSLEALKTE